MTDIEKRVQKFLQRFHAVGVRTLGRALTEYVTVGVNYRKSSKKGMAESWAKQDKLGRMEGVTLAQIEAAVATDHRVQELKKLDNATKALDRSLSGSPRRVKSRFTAEERKALRTVLSVLRGLDSVDTTSRKVWVKELSIGTKRAMAVLGTMLDE
jgi:hypothetical protein